MPENKLFEAWPALAAAAGVFGAAFLFYELTKPRTGKDGVPYAPGYPLIDNLVDMLPDRMLERLDMHKASIGKVFKLKMFGQKFIHLADTQLCREVMQKRPKTFVRAHVLDDMALRLDYLPYGLFHANEAAHWSKVRKTTSPAFSKQNVAAMMRQLLIDGINFVHHLDERSTGDEIVDLLEESIGFTVKVISHVAFGNDQVDYFFGRQFYEDVRTTFQVLLDAAMFPFPRWVWKLTPNYRSELAAVEADRRFTAACQQVIETKRAQHRTMTEDQKRDTHSLIDIMIRQDESRDAEVLANVKTFYLAGSDTTSMAISWAAYLLAQHPAVVDRMRVELRGFFDKDLLRADCSAQEVTEAVAGLTYTHAVLKETMRLYPAGPAIFLDYAAGEEPLTLSNSVTIPTDTTVLLNVWQCLLDDANFTEARSFRPERWLTEDRALLGRMDHAFLVFGAGPRMCPGMGLAMAEGVVALAVLYQHFDVELTCAPQEVRAEFKFTLQPSKLPVRLRRRPGVTITGIP